MNTFSYKTKLPLRFDREFRSFINYINLSRIHVVCIVAASFNLLLLVADLFKYNNGVWETTPAYQTEFFIRLAGTVIFAPILIVYWANRNKIKNQSYKFLRVHLAAFIFALSAWILALTINDQFLSGAITAYVIVTTLFAFAIRAKIIFLVIYYGLMLTGFIVGLSLINIDNNVLYGHLTDGTVVTIISLLLAIFMNRREVQSFLEAKTIERNNIVLSRANEDLAQFAHVASHDLKEPLRMITNYSQLVNKKFKSSVSVNKEEVEDYLNYINEGAIRMNDLINDLLELSQVDKRKLQMEKIDSNTLVQLAELNLKGSIEEKNVALKVEDLPEVQVDKTQMVQLFQNLIGNGIKYNESDQPEIRIDSEVNGNYVMFSVRDNGIGIEPQYKDKIFNLFQRLHGKGEYGGTGIGLSICKKIVERHNGQIWVESDGTNGSVFKFKLPKAA